MDSITLNADIMHLEQDNDNQTVVDTEAENLEAGDGSQDVPPISDVEEETSDDLLTLDFILKEYNYEPEGGLDKKKMLSAIAKELASKPFDTWKGFFKKQNSTIYKQYFGKDYKNNPEWIDRVKELHGSKDAYKHFGTRVSEIIWRYFNVQSISDVTKAFLVKLYEASTDGSRDRARQLQELGEIIVSPAEKLLKGPKSRVWEQRIVLPCDDILREAYTKARIEGELWDDDDDSLNCLEEELKAAQAPPAETSTAIEKEIDKCSRSIRENKSAIDNYTHSINKLLDQNESIEATKRALEQKRDILRGSETLGSTAALVASLGPAGYSTVVDSKMAFMNLRKNPQSLKDTQARMKDILLNLAGAVKEKKVGDSLASLSDNLSAGEPVPGSSGGQKRDYSALQTTAEFNKRARLDFGEGNGES